MKRLEGEKQGSGERIEVGSRRSEGRGQKSEIRRRTTVDRARRAKDGRQPRRRTSNNIQR